ncbi:non-ribosomal peptide synthetase [Paenibacillus hamazuiensis]|uniref:non-ribosomal peptide synthetase n=1 Tax=Paenibacillus hamazuiensis TaxID=2936508 RepID=UPI00200E9166|nr:non-ribosomal peptide synthetase [Paenibacillus hamazuiensis]
MADEAMTIKKELVRYLLDRLKRKELDPEQAVAFIKELQKSSASEPEPIAVVGLSCRFPEAEDAGQFWSNLATGRQSIGPFPANRLEDFQRIKDYSGELRKGGFLGSVDYFDAEYFNIPPRAAMNMDPYHRLLLEVFVESFEDAGYHRGQVQGRNIGIFVGNDHTHRMHDSYITYLQDEDFTTSIGSWTGVLASRLSYLLNLRGPAFVVDSGCSSALLALDAAIKSIREGDCEAALVGGVNITFDPVYFANETQSQDYTVRAFDKDANGTVWSEGVAAVYLKPLSKAMEDRDEVYGIIRGIAVNNDGKSNGLTAPSARAQQEVLLKAWERAGIHPETISYIETHGTGTGLGDPIEIKGLAGAFAKHSGKRQFCAIGSIKTNIGHTVGVAGLASLIKVMLSLKERQLPPSLNFAVPNPLIDFMNSPVYVQDRLTAWEPPAGVPRRAGISSFSLSGTNCHLVVEEAPNANRSAEAAEGWVYPLSGYSYELLGKTVQRHLQFLRRRPELRLEDACFTASTGREHLNVRAAVWCHDRNGLIAGLEALAEALASAGAGTPAVYESERYTFWLPSPAASGSGAEAALYAEAAAQAQARRLTSSAAQADAGLRADAWQQLAALYVQGTDIAFEPLFAGTDVRRCSLPPHIFNNKRYWDETPRIRKRLEEERGGLPDDAPLWLQAEAAGSRLPEEHEAASEAERFLAWIWSEALGYPVIEPQADFYKLGGDSVVGLRIVQAVNDALALDIPISALLEAENFSDFVRRTESGYGLSAALAQARLQAALQRPDVPERADDSSPIPLTPAQNRMFLTAQLIPHSVAYNVTGVMRLEPHENASEVERLMLRLIERHGSLRTSFHMEDGVPVQVVHPRAEFTLERRVLQTREGMSRIRHLQEELGSFIRPFDLAKAPLMRACFYQYDDGDAYLAIDLHHIVTDGSSMGLLFADYAALAEGRAPAALPLSYRDAVLALRSRLESSSMEGHRSWWMEQFADGVPMLNLPTDKPRPGTKDYIGARIFHTIPADLTARAKAMAQNAGATLFMALMGVFHNLLARLGGDRDIVIGTPVAGRPGANYQQVVGMFVGTLPIRTRSEDGMSFSEWLSSLKRTITHAFDHQEYPYESLIEDLQPERYPGRNPLFDVYFALQNIDMGLSGPSDRIIPFESGTAKFDLTVVARETPEGLLMEWEYATGLYTQETIERLARRFERMLAAAAGNPQTTLGELDLMLEGERSRLLEEWNDTATSYPGGRGIVPLFEEWAEIRGSETALRMDGRTLSYEELNARANRIARAILGNGAERGSAVALLLQRSFDMIAAIFGVLKAGCHYVPLDAENPSDRLSTIIRDSGANVLVTHPEAEWHPVSEAMPELAVLDLSGLNDELSAGNLGLACSGDDLAYAMFTSGSTGTPKGTLIRQKSVIRVVKGNPFFTFRQDDVLLQLSNYSFDGSIIDIFGALLNGATLVLLHKREVIDMEALGRIIRENGVNVLFMTTSLFNALVDTNLECLDNVRAVMFGGEAASARHVRKAFARLGPGRLINGYGPTETTVFAVTYTVDRLPEQDNIPIGRAMGNTHLYVLDGKLRLTPIGVPGELYIGGDGLAAGYLNRPELTAERFVPNPFRPGETMYKTGDLVVWSEDGLLRYMGRLDHQVKLRGFRIELGEIEAAAKRQPEVREAHAGIVGAEDKGSRNLALWIVPTGDIASFDTHDLRVKLARMLPDYMVPPFIVPLAAMPLNKNGKIDTVRLPAPAEEPQGTRRGPRNEREMLLAGIWSDVLGISQPGIDDNFFSLGGDSIKAIQVTARLQGTGYSLETADMFQYLTIETLAPRLKTEQAPEGEQGEVTGACLPNPIQTWYLRDGGRISQRFNQAMLICGKGEWNGSRLEAALDRLCRHHDALRLALSPDGELVLRTSTDDNLVYVAEMPADLSGRALEEFMIEVQGHIRLQNGPLVAAAAGSGPDGWRLFIAIHHIAVDVVSWGVLLEDLTVLMADPEAVLPLKTTSFAAWTRALNDWARTGGARNELPYWRSVARQARALPPLFPPVAVLRRDTVRAVHRIDGEVGLALCGEANRAYHTETVHLLLCVLSRALGAWRQAPAVLVQLEGHGRERFAPGLDVSRTAGWFTSAFPVLLDASGEPGEAVVAVKEAVRGVPRRGFGFGALRWLDAELAPEARADLESLQPAISFNYLGVQDLGAAGAGAGAEVTDVPGAVQKPGGMPGSSGRSEPDAADVRTEALPADITVDDEFASGWALDIVAAQTGQTLSLEFRYPRAMFDEGQFAEFLGMLGAAAREIAAYCTGKESGEKTASDFTAARLRQEELENILDDLTGGFS